MVFHGDYEVEFEIHRRQSDSWPPEQIGHMPAMTAEEACERWADRNNLTPEQLQEIEAILPLGYAQF